MKKKEKHSGVYHWLVTIPDKLYPFRTEVEGRWVRGIRAYNATLARYQRKYGIGHYGYKLVAYRHVLSSHRCHLVPHNRRVSFARIIRQCEGYLRVPHRCRSPHLISGILFAPKDV